MVGKARCPNNKKLENIKISKNQKYCVNKINGKEKKVNQRTQTKNKKDITLKYKTKNIKKNKWEGEGGKPKYKQTNKNQK